jgi:hypothetical protein
MSSVSDCKNCGAGCGGVEVVPALRHTVMKRSRKIARWA